MAVGALDPSKLDSHQIERSIPRHRHEPLAPAARPVRP
jgi:hypothetical protein